MKLQTKSMKTLYCTYHQTLFYDDSFCYSFVCLVRLALDLSMVMIFLVLYVFFKRMKERSMEQRQKHWTCYHSIVDYPLSINSIIGVFTRIVHSVHQHFADYPKRCADSAL